MEFTDQHRRMLQTIMSQPQWMGFEVFFEDFMRKNFVESSIKRDTDFNTLWCAAENEGAKRRLLEFKQLLEDEASKV